MAMFHLLKIRTSIGIFKNEKCKVTFGLECISYDYFWVFYLVRYEYSVVQIRIQTFAWENSIVKSVIIYGNICSEYLIAKTIVI